MKSEKNILIAFLLNLSFSVFELIGGIVTGSVAILSDALHDTGDAASIGVAYFLQKKSTHRPDDTYTYGYVRFSVLGGLLTTLILIFGSVAVIISAVKRLINPVPINYNGMIFFAVIGAAVNLVAAYFTREGDSLNEKAVNLHMLEDVLGWIVVLAGAVIMRFTDISVIDPLMSMGVAVLIFFGAVKNLKAVINIFLEKTPKGISVSEIKNHLSEIDGVQDVHHIHIRSLDGQRHCAEIHIVADTGIPDIKEKIRGELREHGIIHATLEFETPGEHCHSRVCVTESVCHTGHCHHHH